MGDLVAIIGVLVPLLLLVQVLTPSLTEGGSLDLRAFRQARFDLWPLCDVLRNGLGSGRTVAQQPLIHAEQLVRGVGVLLALELAVSASHAVHAWSVVGAFLLSAVFSVLAYRAG